jgi:hypothetical protein
MVKKLSPMTKFRGGQTTGDSADDDQKRLGVAIVGSLRLRTFQEPSAATARIGCLTERFGLRTTVWLSRRRGDNLMAAA